LMMMPCTSPVQAMPGTREEPTDAVPMDSRIGIHAFLRGPLQ
jgi:hypothetical protein